MSGVARLVAWCSIAAVVIACQSDGGDRAAPSSTVAPTSSAPSSNVAPTSSAPSSTVAPTSSAPSSNVAPTSSAPSSTVTGRCPPSSIKAVDDAATLTLGPSPGIDATTAAGQPLVVTGTVYDRGCAPLVGVALHVWQTDGVGAYGPGHGTGDLRCCYLQGTVQTDANGRYQLVTVVPGHYQGELRPPPAHIHVEARHPSGGTAMTEIVFADDRYLVNPEADGYVVVTLTTGPGRADPRRGVADLVLGDS